MKYVLITGAAGLIGTGLRENFKGTVTGCG